MDLTLHEATQILQPPITTKQLRALVTALHIQATGNRHTGRAGHPHPIYPWTELSALHAALTPWLGTVDTQEQCGSLCLAEACPEQADDRP